MRAWHPQDAPDEVELPAHPRVTEDTVRVYGPRRFEVARGGEALHVEDLRIDRRPGARYRVVIQNGADDGTARVERGSLILNDEEILSSVERMRGEETAFDGLELRDLNQLVLDLSGDAGSYVMLTVYQVSSPTTTIFGPVELIRTTGAPDEGTWSFDVPGGVAAPFTLFVNNGFADGSARAIAAWVELNGAGTFGTNDFGTAVSYLESDVALQDSANVVHLTIAGTKGTRIEAFITAVVSDTTAPVVTITAPEQGLVTSADSVLVLGIAVDEGVVTVDVNGMMAQVVDDSLFSATVPLLAEGLNVITAVATDATGNQATATTTVTRDTTTPVLSLASPTDGLITDITPTPLVGSVSDVNGATVSVNGVPVPTDSTGAFSDSVALVDGVNVLTVTATDPAGNQAVEIRTVTLDAAPPVLTVDAPTDGLVTDQITITVSGSVFDATPVTVDANGVPLPVDGAGVFSGDVSLVEGANVVTVTATDGAGTTATAVRIVTRDTEAPVLTVDQPADGTVTISENVAVSGTVLDLTAVTLTVNGAPLTVAPDGTFSGTAPVVEGPNTLTFTATDAVGHTASATRSVTRTAGGGLPPDPATVAPPLDMTVATTTFAATEFLYTGANPIQTGVATGTIEPVRVAVLRGRVTGRDGQPTSGVTISILGHPELGQTLTREDGAFDLAVNGGGDLTIRYQKSGLLPVQRTVAVPWQDYVPVDDVVMVGLDPAVTTIDFSQPIEVHQATPQTDADGTRRMTMLFRQGTTAQMVMPDGSTQPLTSLNVRGTEYTVGPNGPNAMPAELPPASAYTYAAELSADEAVAAGAASIQFTQPVALYVENFLGFPTGYAMPHASYDPGRGGWIPLPNGRVIAVLDTSGGIASLDADGDGVADSSAALATLGISDAEREQLAALYGPGQTLWRAAVTHFSPQDLNAPSGPAGSQPPDGGGGGGGETEEEGQKPDKNCDFNRSIIECQSQVFGERVGIVGTPFSLNYRSDRVPGRVSGRTLTLTLTGAEVPSGLDRVRYDIGIAGQHLVDSVTASPNQSVSFVWDGKDAYGRSVQGAQAVTARVTYLYPGVYREPAPGDTSFGLAGGDNLPGVPNRVENELVLVQRFRLGTWDARSQGLGGWTLDVHHAYDPIGRTLYLGDGTRRSANSLGETITTVAGSETGGYDGDGGPATAAKLGGSNGVAVGPDGALYIADTYNNVVRQVTPDGVISTFAGNGSYGYSGDGGPATSASLDTPTRVAVGPDGAVYIADVFNHRIRRVGTGGIITTVAGNGTQGFSGDGGPATAAALYQPHGIAFDRDGGLYIADARNNRIRRVGPDGIIRTVVGTGAGGYNGDAIPALAAQLTRPSGIAIGPKGELYIAEYATDRVRIVSPDGIINTLIGPSGNVGPYDVALGPDGAVYTVDVNGSTLRRLGADSVVVTVAGDGSFGLGGDGGAPAAATFGDPTGIAFGPDGSIFIADAGANRIRRIRSTLKGFDAEHIVIAAENGSEFYEFDAEGRHLRTVDARTGSNRWNFGYDGDGLLATVTDPFGKVTTVERATGQPTALVGPYGQRTALVVDSVGFLAEIIDPAQDSVSLSYFGAGGLLASYSDPRQNTFTVVYDSVGRFQREDEPAGGFTASARTDLANGFETARTGALGRTTTYRVENLPDGSSHRVSTNPAGQVWETTYRADGAVVSVQPDGTSTTAELGPDLRGGREAPIVNSAITQTPGGLVSTMTSWRRTILADSADPFSLVSQTDTVLVNGRLFVSTADAVLRTTTSRTPEGRASAAVMDSLGRVVTQTLPGVAAVNFFYDAQGRLSSLSRGTRTWHYTYDASGRLGAATDPLARTTEFSYDAADRLTGQVLPDGGEVTFAYDAAGNLTSVTPPGRPAHTFQYNAVNLATEYRPPTVGATDPATSYTYDLDRALTRVQRPDGVAVDFTYDAGGRASLVTFPGGLLEYGYDPVTGNLTGVNGPYGGTLSMTYDGSLPTGVQWIGEVAGSVSVAYDNDFRERVLSVNGADPVTFGYDGDGLLMQAGALSAARNAASGLLSGTTLGTLSSAQGYNAFGEISALTWTHGITPLLATSYTRDALGRVETKTEVVGTDTTTWSYAYDLTGRLTQVDRDGVAEQAYGYDANGNRTSLTSAGGTVTATYDAQDRLLTYGTNSYTYTATGELTAKIQAADTTRYTYDVLGNLLAVDLSSGPDLSYLVDAVGRRIGRKVGGVLQQGWLYQDGLNPIAELDGTGAVVSRFVYGTRANVPDYLVKGGVTYRVVSDELGSVRLVVDVATGTIAQELAYDAWGGVLVDTNPGFQPFGYAGGLYDPLSGLVRFGARDYDAEVGRWTSKDPVGFAGGEDNLYAYVGSAPTVATDPTGLCRIDVGWKDVPGIPFGLAQHGYVLLTNPDGTQIVARGGPTNDELGNWGPIELYIGNYQASEDYPRVGEAEHQFINIVSNDCPCDPYFYELESAAMGIAAWDLAYDALGPNSNTVLYYLLLHSGLYTPAPPQGVNAPGYPISRD